jgi:hypothetical protein
MSISKTNISPERDFLSPTVVIKLRLGLLAMFDGSQITKVILGYIYTR